jgi:hypothetical protein
MGRRRGTVDVAVTTRAAGSPVRSASSPASDASTAPPPEGSDQHRGFWYRRAAQELVIHSWDIENTVGDPLPIDPQIAADGIDEYVQEFGPSNWFMKGAAVAATR